jgi:hypothetical protein
LRRHVGVQVRAAVNLTQQCSNHRVSTQRSDSRRCRPSQSRKRQHGGLGGGRYGGDKARRNDAAPDKATPSSRKYQIRRDLNLDRQNFNFWRQMTMQSAIEHIRKVKDLEEYLQSTKVE